MSGTDARKRSGPGRREARAMQEIKEKRKTRITAIIVIAIMLLLFLGAMLINSKYFRRVMTAITIDGVSFSAAEFDYFYNNAVFEYSSLVNEQMGDYASEYLPSNERPHSSQIYNLDTGETWSSFYGGIAVERLSELVSYHNDAVSNGYVMTAETKQNVDDEIANLKLTSEYYGYSSFDAFLQEMYGSSINEKTFRKIAEFLDTIAAYTEYVHASFSYSAADLTEYYDENRDELDIYSYRYLLIYADDVDEEEYDSTDEYEAAKDEALADVLAKAADIADRVQSEEDFIEAARAYDEEAYEDDDSTLHEYQGELISKFVYFDWISDAQREYGDTESFEIGSGAYILFYVSRDSNDYRLVEMRQLLFLRQELDMDDFYDYDDLVTEEYFFDHEAYDEAFELVDSMARARAWDAYDLFVDGGATEELLLELMVEHTDDSTEGGLYTDISRYSSQNRLVPEIENWLFDPERQVGDYELIFTQDFGYHIVFFMGFGERYSDFMSESRMRDRDYTQWHDNLPEVQNTQHWGMILTQKRTKS